jgi:uncharacterized phosphosugar-binding protein
MINKYFNAIEDKLDTILDEEFENISEASKVIAESIQNDGILYIFGCGHSHIFGEELFFRAGGLAAIYPIFHEPLMLHEGPVRASQIERKNDYASNFIEDYEITDKDTVLVVSTSGINPVPVDVANYAKKQGATVVTITSKEYSSSQESRHKEDLKLFEVGDIVIDNNVPKGDAALKHDKLSVAFGPLSSVIGITIIQSMIANATKIMLENDFEAPVFLSGNIAGSDDHNNRLVEKYSERIPLLKQGLEN